MVYKTAFSQVGGRLCFRPVYLFISSGHYTSNEVKFPEIYTSYFPLSSSNHLPVQLGLVNVVNIAVYIAGSGNIKAARSCENKVMFISIQYPHMVFFYYSGYPPCSWRDAGQISSKGEHRHYNINLQVEHKHYNINLKHELLLV